MDIKKIDVNRLADMLESKAKELRGEKLSAEDISNVTGGIDGATRDGECCGSSCSNISAMCVDIFVGTCKNSCVRSSPD